MSTPDWDEIDGLLVEWILMDRPTSTMDPQFFGFWIPALDRLGDTPALNALCVRITNYAHGRQTTERYEHQEWLVKFLNKHRKEWETRA